VFGLREVKQIGCFEHDGKLEETRGVGKGKWAADLASRSQAFSTSVCCARNLIPCANNL
jgi:hypothetical protein